MGKERRVHPGDVQEEPLGPQQEVLDFDINIKTSWERARSEVPRGDLAREFVFLREIDKHIYKKARKQLMTCQRVSQTGTGQEVLGRQIPNTFAWRSPLTSGPEGEVIN
jgi:hypothetical protein